MYQPVPKMPDFPEMERRHLARWAETDAFAKRRELNRGGKPWSFVDGPITANNPMGVHHAWGRSYKDMFQRYHSMNGRELRYQNGFDCQGLWVEVEVEKEYGFGTKADILDYGLDRFVQSCKERVLTYAARQTEQSIRLGYWTDWDPPETLLALRDAMHEQRDSVSVTVASGKTVTGSPEELVGRLGSPEFGGSYFTFSTENNYTIWAFLKKCHDENFVYRGHDVMPWCTRCGTGLSQMEVAEGRKITSHTSVFVRFPLRGREREALLVWTTTPWTLTSNVAAAVNPEMTYLRVRHGEWTYYVGKDNFSNARVQDLEAAGKRETHKLQTVQSMLKGSGDTEVLGELPGKELLGLEYDGPFDHLPAAQAPGGVAPAGAPDGAGLSAMQAHRVIAWDDVSGAEGTGIVHIAPGCGAEDHGLGHELGLPAIAPLNEAGEYLGGFGEWSGRSVHAVADDLVLDLKTRGVLVAKESYPHVYPHCWRCKSELVFRLVDEWFIRMDWRDRIQKVVPDIRWIPADGEAREQDWLLNMGDWMISKKRFWGLALPIWRCEACEWFTVIGGEDELREKATGGWDQFEGHTPHRPWVDHVTIACEGCGATAHRVEDVGNPWLDAGIVPFSTLHYNTNRDYWNTWFPADFVVESFPGQFRNWFYSMLAMSAMMDGRAPFRALLGHAMVRDERGEEMHKSTGNAIAFDEAADVIGAEIMRYLFASQNPTQNLNFPDINPNDGVRHGGLAEEIRRKILTLWNCYGFFVTYATDDRWQPPAGLVAAIGGAANHGAATAGAAADGGRAAAAAIPVADRAELDRWILSRLQRLVQSGHDAFADLSTFRFMASLEQFVDEFSNWYLRRSRRRFWKSGVDADKEAAYQTMYEVLTTLCGLLAPILPFLSEEMYQNLVRSVNAQAPESVHHTAYPQPRAELLDDAFEAKLASVIRLKNAVLKLRNESKVKVRQPLSRILVRPRDEMEREAVTNARFAEQILEECNVKTIEAIDSEGSLVTSSLSLNAKAVGPRYGRIMKGIAAHVATADHGALLDALANGGTYSFDLGGEAVELQEGDVIVRHEGPEGLAFLFDHGSFVGLDTTISAELEREGIARDFNRHAQDRRKAIGLEVSDRIRVAYSSSERVAAALEEHGGYLERELLAVEIGRRETLPDAVEVSVGGEKIQLTVEKNG